MRQRPAGRRWRGEDAGETLIELLVTIAIMATAVTAIVGATATSIHLSDIHRKQAKAGSYVRAYAEALETFVAKPSATGYKFCAGANAYDGGNVGYSTGDASYTPTAPVVKVGNPALTPPGWSASTGCTMDSGVQLVTLQVRYSKSGQVVTESLDVIIRRPCRPTDTEAQCA